ncbi:AarF domain containing kinase 2 (Predicted) [Elysia marginata]|uniref:AarF domain containing kinase 2 (Predicted) n=1 Tax=Elysia marginata TaxID=1093978 RepID=A0AAV4F4V4_9GAST|nr:AarF domain containing kinase 2 (Predicted) [Elysia marginata]
MVVEVVVVIVVVVVVVSYGYTSILCATHLSESISSKPLQRAQCDSSSEISLHLLDKSQVKPADIFCKPQRGFLAWIFQDAIPLGLRAAQLLCLFTPMLITYPLTYLGPGWFDTWLRLLYVAVEYSGATFIKLGQWASTRRDLFSKEVCDCFAHLHFQVRPHAWAHTACILQEAYGEQWKEIFHLFEGQKPIGSGCIAQVYKGYISKSLETSAATKDMPMHKDDSDSKNQLSNSQDSLKKEVNLIPVAIKVLHPSIQDKFNRDMILMTSAARFLTWLFPKLHWVNLKQCAFEFKSVMKAQLDLRQECSCLQRFTEDFAFFEQIRVPRPFPQLVRDNVLVETFEEGISVGHILQDHNQPQELKIQLANIGVDIMLQMVFVNNFVHADLHPGNLLVQNMDTFLSEKQNKAKDTSLFREDETLDDYRLAPKEKNCLRLVLLDCGITSSLEPEDRKKFQEVFTAVVKGEGETVADLFLAKSAVNNCKDPFTFRKEMAQLIKVAEVMNSVFEVLSRHQIQLEANFATIVLAMAMLEGLGRSLNPNLDLLEKARPVLLGSYLLGKGG